MNLTGGLHWHWRAWRANTQWAQTRTEIEDWLLAQPIEKEQLILIGASAGWMMSNAWLSRYKSIETWDIDPLAGPLFKLRHGKALRKQGVVLNCFTGDALTMLPMLLREQPHATIFFDNVLGQIRFQTHTINQAENRLRTISQALRGRHWGSVHDRMSGPIERAWLTTPAPVAHTLVSGAANEGQETQRWLTHMGAKSPWLDHLTGEVFKEGTAVTHMAWPMQKDYWHWLQAGWVTP
jgi:hypothetical protein